MIPAVQPRTCAFCGYRDATGFGEWEGRVMLACDDCLAEHKPEPEAPKPPRGTWDGPDPASAPRGHVMDARVAQVVDIVTRWPGMTSGELSASLGYRNDSQTPTSRQRSRNQYDVIRRVISLATDRGLIRRVRDYGETSRYYPARRKS